MNTNKLKQLLVVSCTKQKKANTKLYKSIRDFSSVEMKYIFHEDNRTGLPEMYNKHITPKTAKKHDIVVFAHDDIYIDDYKIRGKLYNAMQQFDIIGLAGCVRPKIKKPVLWHLMADKKDWRGYVFHSFSDAEDSHGLLCSSFGFTPARVAIIDGLFIAVNIKAALKADWRFNENFEFHHYDISSCLDANQKHLKIGTAPIHVIHDSPGLLNYDDMTFTASENKFIEIYGK